MNKKILFLILLGAIILPSIGFAQLHDFGGQNISINGLVEASKSVVWVVFTLIVVVCFIMAAIMFLTAQGAPEKITTARSAFVWGVVGVVVGVLAYSILTIIQGLL